MRKPNLKIIIGSTRPGRNGATVGGWFYDLAVKQDKFSVELVDLAVVDLPLLNEPENPRHGRYVHEHTKEWSRTISAGDAYVFVVPEYNRGYNAATKNALDYLHNEWRHKPVGFVSYGGISAGTRSVQMLIQVVTALGMVPAVTAVNIPLIARMVSPDKTFTPNPILEQAAAAMLDELSCWTTRLEPMHRDEVESAARRPRRSS
jgi:NAD(P)H-dependent FMN reductase